VKGENDGLECLGLFIIFVAIIILIIKGNRSNKNKGVSNDLFTNVQFLLNKVWDLEQEIKILQREVARLSQGSATVEEVTEEMQPEVSLEKTSAENIAFGVPEKTVEVVTEIISDTVEENKTVENEKIVAEPITSEPQLEQVGEPQPVVINWNTNKKEKAIKAEGFKLEQWLGKNFSVLSLQFLSL